MVNDQHGSTQEKMQINPSVMPSRIMIARARSSFEIAPDRKYSNGRPVCCASAAAWAFTPAEIRSTNGPKSL
jgi:hypothetical protein